MEMRVSCNVTPANYDDYNNNNNNYYYYYYYVINEYKIQTLRQHTTPCVRRIQDSKNDMRKELSKLVETRKDNK